MTMRRCFYCMEDMRQSVDVCPRCRRSLRRTAGEQKPYALPCGSTLRGGKYLIGRVLGEGGFGLTYMGYDQVLQLRVCIKEYFPAHLARRAAANSTFVQWRDEVTSSDKRASFLREARNAVQLRNLDAVVKVWDVFDENGTSYIVMSFIEGSTLKDYLKRSQTKLDYYECVKLLDPVMGALEEIHKLDIIHRDISPDNLMLQPDGKLILLDLGAAKKMTPSGTKESERVAKKGFSPPEQYIEKGRIGPWTDVYALAATIYFCVTGVVPPAVMDKKTLAELDMKAFPKRAAAVMRKALAARPEDRYRSMAEFRAALKKSVRPNRLLELIVEYKASFIAAAVALVCLCGVGITALSMQLDRDRNRIEAYGCPNSDLLNSANFIFLDDREYFISADNSLYLCERDEDTGRFYPNDATEITDHASEITTDGESVYFMKTTTDNYRAICRMNADGSGLSTVRTWTGEGQLLNYQLVTLGNGKQYLYYHVYNTSEQEKSALYRFELGSGREELLVSGAYWFNVYDKYLFYSCYEPYEAVITLYRSDLDGRNPKRLTDANRYTWGIVADDAMILYSVDLATVVVCDLEGVQQCHLGNCDIDTNFFTVACKNGWIYYNNKGDGSIHRVRLNGTGDEVYLADALADCITPLEFAIYFKDLRLLDRTREFEEQMMYYFDEEEPFPIGDAYTEWLVGGSTEARYFTYVPNGEGVTVTGYTGSETCFNIPDTLGGKPVTAIGESAFEGSAVEMVGLPETVRSIGDEAFHNCVSLRFIGLNEGLEEIGLAAFGQCHSLGSAELPESLQSLGALAFAESGLREVHIPAALREIGAGCFAMFSNTGFTEIRVDRENPVFEVRDGVLFERSGEDYALLCYPSGRVAVSYTIPDEVTQVSPFAFCHAKALTEVVIPDSVRELGQNAFLDTALKSITVSRSCEVAEKLGGEITVNRH